MGKFEKRSRTSLGFIAARYPAFALGDLGREPTRCFRHKKEGLGDGEDRCGIDLGGFGRGDALFRLRWSHQLDAQG
jgi:hypothetical protein